MIIGVLSQFSALLKYAVHKAKHIYSNQLFQNTIVNMVKKSDN